jgi:LysM repeat protein
MSLWERFNVGLQSLFSAPALRLAPLIVTLALVLFSTGTLVTLAQTAVPGDLAYTLKQWIRKQELVLAPASQRDLVRQEQERELAADVAKAASRADANSAVIRAEDTQIYYGRNGRLLKIGGLTVMDRYQPDANVEIFKEMSIEGDLLPGTQVSLEYQIMPGQSATVQGIALTVVAPPSDTDVLDTNVLDEVVPGINPPDVGACAVAQPEGWVPYTVRAGDNLTFLASRGGTSITKLMEVNCLQSENILIGDTLYVPAPALETNRPLLTCGSAVPANWTLYEVQAGDSLSVIAARSGISLDELMAINCLNSDIIVIGAQLYVPPAASD